MAAKQHNAWNIPIKIRIFIIFNVYQRRLEWDRKKDKFLTVIYEL